MKKTRLISVLAAVGATVALAGCGTSGPAIEQSAETPNVDSNELLIGFSISTLQNPFFVSMEEGVRAGAAETGAEVLIADAGDDAIQQSNDILNFIAQGVDVAILNPTDGDAIVSSVEALNQAGIPVITVDRRSEGGEVRAHIGTDNVTAGEATATAFFEAIGGKGEIAILEGIPGASSAIDRGTGFENVLADYPDITVVATQTANYQRSEGLTVAQNILQANPNLVGFLSMNDEMALGAVEALRAAGSMDKVKVIGIDGGEDAVAAVKAGELVATVAQQSKLMGELSVKEAVRLAEGETIEKDQPVDVIVIDESNASEY